MVITHTTSRGNPNSVPPFNMIQFNFDSIPANSATARAEIVAYLRNNIIPTNVLTSVELIMINNGFNTSNSILYLESPYNFFSNTTWSLTSPHLSSGSGYVMFRNGTTGIASFIVGGYTQGDTTYTNGRSFFFSCAYNDVCFMWGLLRGFENTTASNTEPLTPLSSWTVAHVSSLEYNKNGISFLSISLNSSITTDTDPFAPGGTQEGDEPIGGNGEFDDTSDIIEVPPLPTLSAADTGFMTLYNPTAAELKALAAYMWNNTGDFVDTLTKIYNSPMDAMLGLSIVPVNVPSGGVQTVKVGNISTTVSMTTASTQYVNINCGSVTVPLWWGSYLDYSPYTRLNLYLPYCGAHEILADDVIGKTVGIQYNIDILSGSCAAFISIGSSVAYQFAGQCSVSVPMTSTNFASAITGAIQSITGQAFSALSNWGIGQGSALGQNLMRGAEQLVTGGLSMAANSVMGSKPSVQKSGTASSMAGMLSVQVPYFYITYPRQVLPPYQNTFTGYPSFFTKTPGSLSGYTQYYDIHLDGLTATQPEIDEIREIMMNGVIL